MIKPIYSDLFDDGISDFNFLLEDIGGQSFEIKLLDAARFQVLLAILFGRQIAIPETWLASSPLFLRLFNEVDKNYPATTMRFDSSGPVEVTTVYPFKFVFFEEAKGNPAQQFLHTLANRMRDNRRIQWLPSQGKKEGENANLEVGKKLTELLAGYGEVNDRDASQFAGDFTDILETRYGTHGRAELSAISNPLSNVCKLLLSPCGQRNVNFYGSGGQSLQRSAVQHAVEDVRSSVFDNPRLKSEFAAETEQFQEFFSSVQKANISTSDVMGMWPILNDCGATVRRTAEAFGRLALNRGLAASTGSGQGTLSFNYYSGGQMSDFSSALLRESVSFHARRSPNSTATSFFDLAQTSSYDLTDTIDWVEQWDEIWKTAARIAQDPSWALQRSKIEDELLRRPEDERYELDKWAELFDAINSRFQEFKFEILSENERPAARILRKEMDKHPVSGQTKALWNATVSLTGLQSITQMFQDAAAGRIGTENSLKVVRKVRRISWRQVERSSSDLIVSNGG